VSRLRHRVSRFNAAACAVLAVLCVGAAVAPGTARADENDPARVKARALAEKGDLAFGTGRCDQALPMWRLADQVFPAPTLKLRIAHCDALLGKVVDAAAALQAIVDTKLPPDAPPPWLEASAQAALELPATRARIARLVVEPHVTRPLTQVVVDDAPRPVDAAEFSVDPGHHRLALTSGTASAERSFDVDDGQTRKLVARSYIEPAPEPPHTGRTVAYTFGAAGVAALAVGTIFGVAALTVSHDLDTICGSTHRDACPTDQSSRISKLKTDAVLSDAFLASGVVLVGIGSIFFVRDARTPKPDPIPKLTITGSRLILGGSF
jgi:hypothetical protein